MPGCCCYLNNTCNKILFSINWQWVNKVFHVAFLQGLSMAIFTEKQTLLLHLFTAKKKTLQSIFGWAMCMTFWLGLTCYSHTLVHRFTGCFWRKSPWHSGEMWYQQDRAAAHFARQFGKHLTATYNTRWIGQDWRVVWPARSPDLTQFYFFL
jgi:hypothetical protein